MANANDLALDLEDQIPAESRNAASLGVGVLADIAALVADVKAKNWQQAALDFAKLIQDLAGQTPTQLAALGGGKINWQNILAILAQLLPIIGGFLVPTPA